VSANLRLIHDFPAVVSLVLKFVDLTSDGDAMQDAGKL